ncbi:unnamed protein product, partial [Iphiclides podalirius]
MRDEARNTFKKHVNSLAIIKNQNNEKWLILKKKYMPSNGKENDEVVENKVLEPTSNTTDESSIEPNNITQPYHATPPLQLNQDFSILANIIQDTNMGTSKTSKAIHSESQESLSASNEDIPPKVHPRRKATEKFEKRSSIPSHSGPLSPSSNHDVSDTNETLSSSLTSSRSESMLVDNEHKISVKERKQMFNRMASESDVPKSHKLSFNNSSVDEEDRVSLDHKGETDPLDSKQKLWILCAARGEYHSLAKMCKENAKLVKTKVL